MIYYITSHHQSQNIKHICTHMFMKKVVFVVDDDDDDDGSDGSVGGYLVNVCPCPLFVYAYK